MSIAAKIIADSVGPNQARLTTFQLRFQRFLLPQFNTHASVSKNARSSRAVPIQKLIIEAETDPAVPLCWGKRRRGMQATEELDGNEAWRSKQAWLDARDHAVASTYRLLDLGVHKQTTNRLLEPFLWVDVVATATYEGWANLFALRCHHEAQPEFQALAVTMARLYRDSEACEMPEGGWHLPYIDGEDQAGLIEFRRDPDLMSDREIELIKCSVARCARVSYTAFDGTPVPLDKDIAFHDELVAEGHWSPTAHQGSAQAKGEFHRSGNFIGFDQYRQLLPKSVHTSFDFTTLDAFGEKGYLLKEVA